MQTRSPLQQFIDSRTDSSFITDSVLPFSDEIKKEGAERHAVYAAELETAGIIEELEQFKKQDKGRAQTRLMSDKAADRMERLAVSPLGRFRTLGTGGYHNGQSVSLIGANSESVEELPNYRRNNSIPYVAQQKRANLLKELTCYMDTQAQLPGHLFRMWVIHNGPRCQSIDLPTRWRQQNKLVTRWNALPFAKRNGISVMFRSNEAGSPVKKAYEKTLNKITGKFERRYLRDETGERVRCLDENGKQTYHPHTHLLVEFTKWLKDEQLFKFAVIGAIGARLRVRRFWPLEGRPLAPLKDTGYFFKGFAFRAVAIRAASHFGTPKLDAGRIFNAREVCKYFIKGDELHNLKDIDFIRFLKWTFKRRVVETYGDLKQRIRGHKRDGLKVKAVWDVKEGKCVYKVQKNYNAQLIQQMITKDAQTLHLLEDLRRMDEETTEQKADRQKLERCALIAKMAPLAYFGPIKEPIFMVRGTVDINEFRSRPEIDEVLIKTQFNYDNACAVFECLHGVTPAQWMQGIPATVEAVTMGQNGVLIASKTAVLLGSAHNPPVISISPVSSKQSEATTSRTSEQRDPVGAAKPGAFTSVEPEQFNFSSGLPAGT